MLFFLGENQARYVESHIVDQGKERRGSGFLQPANDLTGLQAHLLFVLQYMGMSKGTRHGLAHVRGQVLSQKAWIS